MVVRDLHLVGSVHLPDKADAILIVDANAMLTGSVSLQSLQPVSGWEAQVAQIGRGLDLVELADGDLANRRPAFAKPCFKELPCLVVLEAPDHYRQTITERVLRQSEYLPSREFVPSFPQATELG